MRILAAAVAAAVALAAPAPSRAQALKTEDEKTLYAMGAVAARSFQDFNLTAKELEVVKRGLTDSLSGKKLQVDVPAYEPKVQELARKRMASAAEARKAKEMAMAEAAAKEKGAEKTASGLVYVPIKDGTGESPKVDDTVKVHYEGKLTDGKIFDSSVKRGQPTQFPLKGVIPCWTEGLQKMKVGGKARLWCPSSTAYGDQGRPPVIPGGATLVFEVELLEITKPAAQ
ncbi:MAG TPA: FKBP-type peptidyl-prolyl cis-trans isomerase [Anaeromyxobacteraceae bacterium]|nr:FKBP-type peptidyl-prolyl cis-trans isomerase [Anaeromyxobacteraceae bacterium]